MVSDKTKVVLTKKNFILTKHFSYLNLLIRVKIYIMQLTIGLGGGWLNLDCTGGGC